jgi:hypothetical protein
MLRSSRVFVMTLCAAASLSVLAAGEPTDKSTWEKFGTYPHQQKNAAVAEGSKLIAESDKKITELAKQASQSSAETKAAHEKNMKELQEKSKQAQAELAKMEKASSNAWDATKEGFSNAYKDLSLAYDKAVAAVKK